MEPIDQQNQDRITLESLKHTVEANAHAITEFRKESADMCLEIKSNIRKHHESMSHLLSRLSQLEEQSSVEVKNKLEKLFFTVREFYDKEYTKCCHSAEDSFEESSFYKQAVDDKDNVTLGSTEDMIDKEITQCEIVLARIQQQQHEQQQQEEE